MAESLRSSSPQPPAPWRAWWSRPLGRFLDHVLYRTIVHGRDNVPRKGAVIFAANHLSYLDGPVMVGACQRYMHVLVRHEMFRGFLGWVLRASGQIPLNRSGDRAALQAAKAVLNRGGCIGILPEGTRGTGDASSVSSGVAWLALNSPAVVVPVAILGTRVSGEHRDAIPPLRRRFQVSFGEPLRIERPSGMSGRAAMDAATRRIQAALAEQVRRAVTETGQALPEDTAQEPGEDSGQNPNRKGEA